jgi:hypothetical protein
MKRGRIRLILLKIDKRMGQSNLSYHKSKSYYWWPTWAKHRGKNPQEIEDWELSLLQMQGYIEPKRKMGKGQSENWHRYGLTRNGILFLLNWNETQVVLRKAKPPRRKLTDGERLERLKKRFAHLEEQNMLLFQDRRFPHTSEITSYHVAKAYWKAEKRKAEKYRNYLWANEEYEKQMTTFYGKNYKAIHRYEVAHRTLENLHGIFYELDKRISKLQKQVKG